MLETTSLFAPVAAVPVVTPPQTKPLSTPEWSYEEAFKRNRGLITEEEQEKLRHSRVAIAGMGGVGGVHLITLARLGVGKFTIADPDTFDVANTNRQYGATVSNLGRNKAEAMAEMVLDVNPELDIQIFQEKVDAENIDAFLEDADLYVDGLDFFAIDARRLVFRKAAERGMWSLTAGPIGFSAACLAFDPAAMSFDRYFDLRDGMSREEMLAAFAVGLTPQMSHLPYTDLSYASIKDQTGPSCGLACQLASGYLAADATRILLGRDTPAAAPSYQQFDAYEGREYSGRLPFGNRGPIQRVKRRAVRKRFTSQSSPPVLRFASLIAKETFSRRTLTRRREPTALTEAKDKVLQYDQVMQTKLAIAYALGIEVIYRCRQKPFGGTALDIACGPGHMSLAMTEHLKLDQLLGVDLSQPMVDVANGNARKQQLPQAGFALGNATDLQAFDDASLDLCTFCDAAHHMIDLEVANDDPQANEKDLAIVGKVLREMDRVTKPDGFVFVMDLVRLKTAEATEEYVELLGSDYSKRGLSDFKDDFRNSMYAAWTLNELASASPESLARKWFQWSPRGLSSAQFIIGTPLSQCRLLQRDGLPWVQNTFPDRSLRRDWILARRSFLMSSAQAIGA